MPPSTPGYERLAARDAAFVDLEDGHASMLLGAVLVLDAAPLMHPDGTLAVDRVRALVRSRLHRVPRFRRKLVGGSLASPGAWVDDDRFELDYHVRHVALPRPGDERELLALAGALFSQRLDPQRPLWEFWCVEGLARGRCAIVCKMHHGLVDGIAGVGAVGALLLSPAPDGDIGPPRPWVPVPPPSAVRLRVDELWRRARDAAAVASTLSGLPAPGEALGFAARALRSMARHFLDAVAPASETPFNGEVGPGRSLAWTRASLAVLDDIRCALGGTVNDVVLAAVAGAVRRFLLGRRLDADGCDFRVLVPVNVREGEDAAAVGNGIAAAVVRLPVGEGDARRRLAMVRATMAEFKESGHASGFDALLRLGDSLVTSVASGLFRLTNRLRTYNMMVTNVPGPAVPLYLLGAPVLEAYPVAPLFVVQRVSIAVLGYAGWLYWGFSADRALAADAGELAELVQAELQLLRRAAASRVMRRQQRASSNGAAAAAGGVPAAAAPAPEPPA